jgi:hypothetical protein
MELVAVKDWSSEIGATAYAELEAGNILFFPEMPIEFSEDDRQFLLAQRRADAPYHKNIAYRPQEDVLTGTARGSGTERLRRIMRSFSEQSARLLSRVLARYAASWRLDYASFRPHEEAGRHLRLHARNDLLHFDAFPTRPTHGDRILRFFVNLHPEKPRVWVTTDSFPELAERYASQAGLARLARREHSPLGRLPRKLGIARTRPAPYDTIMHCFHNFLKENEEFQRNCPKQQWAFPPQSSWLVLTDMVCHAVLSGQMALEQTFIVAWRSMLNPEWAPAAVLQRVTGLPVTDNNS